MRASIRLLAQQVHTHKPLIHFLGKRPPPTEPHHPAPHPSAPEDIKLSFASFLQKLAASAGPQPHPSSPSEVRAGFGEFAAKLEGSDSSSAKGGGEGEGEVYANFWDAPERYWRKGHEMSEVEMDAISSGGATKW